MVMREIELRSAAGMTVEDRPFAIKPCFDRVLLRPIAPDDVTPGGIYLPDAAQERSQEGEVIAVGPGKVYENGEQIASTLEPGQRVLYGKYGGSEVTVGGKKYVILCQDDILAVLV